MAIASALTIGSSENSSAQAVEPFPEFDAQWGLGAVNILPAWSQTTGAGVTVAIVDSGVRLSHQDIQPNLASTGRDFVNNDSAANDDSFDGHGTRLAGIVAAARNGAGIVGVAYNARILPVKVRNEQRIRRTDLTAAGIDFAANQGAQVINLSLPGDADTRISNAIVRATTAGSIVVMAAGNTGGGGPMFPAVIVSNPALSGRGIAVGSISPDGNISDFSNRAGSKMNFYLVAPGEQILSTTNTSNSALAAGTGTSFAAPHVAGGAALLSELFPNISPEQVVQILLETATDLGAAGADEVYGRGLLNLGAAVSPQGDLVVPGGSNGGSSSGGAAVGALALGGAIGFAVLNKNDEIETTLILDQYGRGYALDLTKATEVRDGHYDLSGLMGSLDRKFNRLDVPISEGTTARLYYATPQASLYANMDDEERLRLAEGFSREIALDLSGGLNEDLSYTLGFNLDPRQQFGNAIKLGNTGATFLSHQSFSTSYMGFAQTGNAMHLNYDTGDALDLHLGYTEMSDGDDHGLRSRAAMFEGELQASDNLTLGLQFGLLVEQGNLFGGSSGNAWGVDATETLSFGISGAYDLSAKTTLVGNYAVGHSRVEEMEGGLLKDFSGIRSNAYGFGMFTRSVFQQSDTLGVAWSQPLRATRGEATLDIPTGIDAENRIYRSSDRVELNPDGQEQDFEAVYATALGKRSHLSAHLLYQHEPQHNSEANDAMTLLFALRSRF